MFTISILGNNDYDFPKKQSEPNLQDFLEQDVNIKTKPMCEKVFNVEYEQIISSDKEIYQCNVSSGFQDCKVGIKVSPTIRAGNNCTHVLQRFEFPPKQELKLKLKDMLEDEVDERYYLTDSMIKTYQRDFGSKGKEIDLEHPIPILTASMGTGGGNVPILKQVGKLDIKGHDCIKRVYSDEGLSPTLTDMQGGNRQPKVELKSKCKRLFDGLRIRKITPKEAWRLMGFDDEDFEAAEKVNSNTQLYKQAGNSIVVNVLEAILEKLLKD